MNGELIATGWGSFNGDIVDGVEKSREMGLREFEDVAGEAAGASGGFDEQEFAGAIELAPHFGELAGEETSEDGMDVDTGVVVTEAADFGLRIVAVDPGVEALAHVFGGGDRA